MQHTSLVQGRWFTFTLSQQLGNIGSEFERAAKWVSVNDAVRFEGALARFLELLDLTISDPRWTGFRRQELLRLREVATGALLEEGSGSARESLKKYFYYFELAAARPRV